MTDTNAHLLRLARLYASARGLTLSSVGLYAANAGTFFVRLERGHDITTRRAARVIQWFSDHWPPGDHWPADIPRPERTDREAA